jgi:hypothetical protein
LRQWQRCAYESSLFEPSNSPLSLSTNKLRLNQDYESNPVAGL